MTSVVRHRLPCSGSNLVKSRLPRYIPYRQFASQGQQETPFSGSSKEAADLRDRLERQSKTAPGANANAKFGPERVGPFPMGGGRVSSKKWAPWKDLDIGGKVVRTTAQTGNLTVVICGGALFVLLAYSLSTELFSRNSPTVLLNEAIDLIEDSEIMDLHLLRPYSFTHLPSPSSSRRSSPVQSQIVRNPETGNEHLVMRFWVHGRRIDEDETTMGWINARWREGKVWVKQAVRDMGGDDIEGTEERLKTVEKSSEQAVVKKEEKGWMSSIFGALRPSLARQNNLSTPLKNLPPAGTFTSGEGRVDFYRDPESGTYKMLTLTVDVPGTRKANQRAVLFWSGSEQVAQESILEGKNYKITF